MYCARNSVSLIRSLIRAKEESILNKRYATAQIAAELVLSQKRPRQALVVEKPFIGIQVFIAEVFINLAVIVRRSALGQDIDVSTRTFSRRRVVEAGLNAKLLDSVGGRYRNGAEVIAGQIIGIDTVDDQVVAGSTLAAHINRRGGTTGGRRLWQA